MFLSVLPVGVINDDDMRASCFYFGWPAAAHYHCMNNRRVHNVCLTVRFEMRFIKMEQRMDKIKKDNILVEYYL